MRTQVPINVPVWWLIIMPVLSMLLIGVIVLIVINIVNTRQKNIMEKGSNNNESKDKNSKDKTLTSWIKKKDLLYWLLIICLGTISLFTFRYKDATEVISHWGFAGTIVSIILAVIAIGFTLFQTLSSNLSSEKIAVSADKIEKASEGIDTEELLKSSIIMKDAAEFLKNEIIFIKANLEDIKVVQESSNLKLEDYFSNNNYQEQITEEQITEEQITDEELNLDYFIKTVFDKLPLFARLYSYSVFKLKHHKLYTTNNVKSISKIFSKINIVVEDNEHMMEYSQGVNLATAGSTKAFLSHFGLIREFSKKSEQDRSKILIVLENRLEEQKACISALKKFIKEKQE